MKVPANQQANLLVGLIFKAYMAASHKYCLDFQAKVKPTLIVDDSWKFWPIIKLPKAFIVAVSSVVWVISESGEGIRSVINPNYQYLKRVTVSCEYCMDFQAKGQPVLIVAL